MFRWTFQQKVAKRWLNSWKSTKNHRFGQFFITFRTNYHVFVFRYTFQEKVAKSCSFREKAPEIIDLAKTLQLFEQTSMSFHFDELFRKKLEKVAHFVRKDEKPSIWPKLATFRLNYDVLAFSWTFQIKVAKSAWLREKTRKTIDFAKTFNFSSKLRCLGIFMNFSERNCKKCVILWKSTKNHRFRQNLQLFEKTTMFLRFDELYGKKLQKLPHFVEKHEKSRIWPKLCNFFEQTTMFGCLDELFSKRLQKGGSIREKARKIIDLAKTMQLFEETTMTLHFDEIWGKRCKKCLIS